MKKIITILLDGFGYREEENGNAIKLAKMPHYNELMEKYPHSLLLASGEEIGLPEGKPCSCELSHMTLGAGKLLKSRLNVINDSIKNNEITNNIEFKKIIEHVKEKQSKFHIFGMISDGKIHSDINYIKKIIRLVKDEGITKVYFHAITDGLDVSNNTAINYINDVKTVLDNSEIGKLATVCGRHYAMDRDENYDNTKLYYDMLVSGKAIKFNDVEKAVNICYKKNMSDDKIPPFILDENGLIEDNDGILWTNYRTDRSNQILSAITNPNFKYFETKNLNGIKLVTLFECDKYVVGSHLFEDNSQASVSLGIYLSELGLTQARIAESVKYSLATHWLDGADRIKGIDYYKIASPEVTTYRNSPHMRLDEVKNTIIKCLDKDYDFIFVNVCNPDIMANTGDLKTTIETLEYMDYCLGEILDEIKNNFYTLFLLSDHGNCEYMLDDENNIVTGNSTFPVPFLIADEKVKVKNGTMCNVAPTILQYMDIALPKDMKETKNLFKE